MPLYKEINDSDTIVISATGYGNKLSLPVSKFYKKSGLDNSSKITLVDNSKLKTLSGLHPEFNSFYKLVSYLESLISSVPHNNLIVTGTSGGGHTALLLGHILRADNAVAFSPYPYLSIKEFKRMKDPALYSMARVISEFDKLPYDLRKYFDLKNVLSEWNSKTEYFVHVSRYNKWGYNRANYLNGLPNVNIITHPYTEHAIASMLSKDSKLKDCFSFPYENYSMIEEIIPHLALPYRVLKKKIRNLKRFTQSPRKRTGG